MNITKQRKRRQHPTNHSRLLMGMLGQNLKRLEKKGAMFRNRKLPEPMGDTLVFRRFAPYQAASPDQLAKGIAITRTLFEYGLQKSNEQLTP